MDRQQAVQVIVETFKEYEQAETWKHPNYKQRYLNEEGIRRIKKTIIPITGKELFFDAYLNAWLYRN